MPRLFATNGDISSLVGAAGVSWVLVTNIDSKLGTFGGAVEMYRANESCKKQNGRCKAHESVRTLKKKKRQARNILVSVSLGCPLVCLLSILNLLCLHCQICAELYYKVDNSVALCMAVQVVFLAN